MNDEDDFLTQARRNWRDQDAEVEAVGRRLRASTRLGRLMGFNDLAAGVLGVIAGLVILWMGVSEPDGFLILAGLTLTFALPPLCWIAWRTRRREAKWDIETPEGVLRQMLARTTVDLNLMRFVRWQGLVLMALTVGLWGIQAIGWTYTRRLPLISVLYLATVALMFGWAWWRERGIRRERERCERLLAEFR